MSEDLIGRKLGAYEIVSQLGMGGMATVYLAHQPSMDRTVAIKVLPRAFSHDPTFVGRFKQEAKVIAKLENARILPVYDYGEDDGITYIVMRYLNAGTLSERIEAGAMPLGETARIISQVAEGLDYAHKRGVIHRDIKPGNILLDESGDVYVTDFGIARLAESTSQFTGSGIVGTPTYISPEQAMGNPVDARTDIYSLGVVLYQMVTGDVPFSAETPMAVVIKHINEPLPLPRTVKPDIPANVEAVILRALAKNADARFESAGAMAAALREAVAHPSEAAPQIEAAPVGSLVAALAAAEPNTMPLAAPSVPETAQGLPTAVRPIPKAQAGEVSAAAEKKPRPRWLVPAIVGGVLVCCMCSLLAAATRNQRQAGDRIPTATSGIFVAEATSGAQEQATEAGFVGDAPTPEAAAETDEGTAGVQGFSADFSGAELPPALVWLHAPVSDTNWGIEDGRLRIDAVPGTTFVADQPPTVLGVSIPARVTMYTTEVTVQFAQQPAGITGAGIGLVTRTGEPLVALMAGSRRRPEGQVEAIYFDHVETQHDESYAPFISAAGSDFTQAVRLRLVVQPGQVEAYFSFDGGATWELVGQWPVIEARVGGIGLFTAAGDGAQIVAAYFDDFSVMAGLP
jgi:predicted Ser/Thr protein kinase